MAWQQQQAQQQQLWGVVAAGEALQVAAALQALAAGRHTPATPEQVVRLLEWTQRQQPAGAELVIPACSLLARWCRHQSLQPAASRDEALLARLVAAGRRLLANAAISEPRLAATCLLLLGCAAAASSAHAEEVAEAVGSALLSGQLGSPEGLGTADVFAAVGALMPALMGHPQAACWVLAALLHWLGGCQLQEPTCLALDCVSPAYGLMRGVATTALTRLQPAVATSVLLRPAYQVLKSAAAAAIPTAPGGVATARATTANANHHAQGIQQQLPPAQAAAAVLALGGLAEALLRYAAGYAEAAQLAVDVESCLAALVDATAVAMSAAAGDASLGLLCDACSLTTAQLAAAVRRAHVLPAAAAASLARCQAHSLLHSVLSLSVLCRAADATVPPAEASLQMKRLAGCALAQHAGSITASLAAQYRLLHPSTQLWLVQQVEEASQQAHRQYRRYSLTAPADWVAAVDGLSVRQLLDKLFLSSLVLLAAAWEAASAASGALPSPQRAQLAAGVVCVLADLQFCRTATPQYAALLKAALSELPGSAPAAARLAACLPCYAELARSCAARGGQATWVVDGVAAAKLQLLMNALVPSCGLLPQVALEQRVAPLAFLYALHPHTATATAAHQLFCALLVAVEPEERRAPLAAYYVRRCLEGIPGSTPLAAFGQGLATILQSLPVGDPAGLLCLQRVLDKWQELAARADPASQELGVLAAQQLLLVDHVLLDGAMQAVDQLLQGQAAQGTATVLRRELLAAVQHTDDCLRKPVLARWLLGSGGGIRDLLGGA